nr:hypothetical protein [Tanacetum cinerariifolium]
MRTNPLPRLGEGIYTPYGTGHVGFVGVQHSLGPFLGPISILRALALFYGTTDTLRVSYKPTEREGIYTPNGTGHVGFVGVQHSLGPFLGLISILRALALFYGTTDTLRVSYKPTERRNHIEKSLQNFKVVHQSSISFKDTSQISSIHSIAPIESTKEPEHLLSMGYEHLSITPKTESDEVTESNVENLLPIPSKCEDNDNFDFSYGESLPDEDVPAEDFKIYLNPLFDEDKINSDKLDPHCFNVESIFVESLLNRDTFIDFSSKFDFSGELAHIKPEIPKSDFDFEEEIRLIENLLYDNSFPRPPEELNAEIADTIIESTPLLPIPVQDGNSQQKKIDIVTGSDNVLPLKGDIRFLEVLLIDDSILSHESFDSSFEDSLLIPRPPPEPPDDNFDLEPEEISE